MALRGKITHAFGNGLSYFCNNRATFYLSRQPSAGKRANGIVKGLAWCVTVLGLCLFVVAAVLGVVGLAKKAAGANDDGSSC